MNEHDHEHDAPRTGGPEGIAPRTDPAGQSLADALRVSFRLLTVIMALVVVAFLLTGVKSIEPQQAGIVKVFGKVTGRVGQGLAYTWPYPIGEIEIVDVKEGEVKVNDFWMYEPPGEELKDLDRRQPVSQGLRPGWDGALLSGDRNLVHLKLVCTYTIRDPVVCKRNILDLNEAIRSAVCSAAVSAAAERTSDSIMLADIRGFAADVRRRAQEQLDAILDAKDAIVISGISIPASSWPLKARSAYSDAVRAGQEAERIRNEAIADARNTLQSAAGAGYVKLVGEAWAPSAGPADPNNDLIGQYDAARRAGKSEEAAALLGRIDNVLQSRQTTGQAYKILAQAQSDRIATGQAVKKRVEEFRNALPGYKESGQFMLERLWADTRDKILSAKTVEKFYVVLGAGKTIVRIGRDPEVLRQVVRALQEAKANETKSQGEKK